MPPRGRRNRCVEAMDVERPDVAGGAKGTAGMGRVLPPWQAEAGAALERPNVEMPQVYQQVVPVPRYQDPGVLCGIYLVYGCAYGSPLLLW